jgi:hypothetical protein
VNIIQGKKEVMGFLSGKVFYFFRINHVYVSRVFSLSALGKHEIELQLPYFFIFYLGFISNHIYDWSYLVARELGS